MRLKTPLLAGLLFINFLILSPFTHAEGTSTSSNAIGTTNGLGVTPATGLPSGAGKAFNPDTSVNFLGLYQHGNQMSGDASKGPGTGATHRNGLILQEAELQFLSDVDPYFRANALFSIAPKDKSRSAYEINPEEVFLETTSLPYVTVKAGKFKTALGKHNQLHTHAYPFIDAPLIHQQLLGDEGLNEAGVSVAALIPVSWYSEVTLQGFSAANEQLYNAPDSGEIAGLAHLKNLFDLTDDLTMEIGFSGTRGRNAYMSNSSVLGSDLTFKYRPAVGGKYKALIWSTEYLDGNRQNNPAGDHLGGLATWVQYQFAERWWIQGRYENVGFPAYSGYNRQQRESALVGLFPSEFSGFRLQYDRMTGATDVTAHNIAFQWNISIGAHPAHAY